MANLKFKDVITIRSTNKRKYLAAEKDGSTNINRNNASLWERFLILNPLDISSVNEIKTGDKIALLSYHNKFLVCEPSGEINCNRENLGSWEIWEIFNWSSTNVGDLINLNSVSSSFITLKSHTGKYTTAQRNFKLTGLSNNIDTTSLNTEDNETALAVTAVDWTLFHYGRYIGEANCPKKGRYDGINCFIAKIPEGSPFIYKNNFYYTTNNQNPVLGDWDGANAKVGNNDYEDAPFLHNNSFYLGGNKCKTGDVFNGDWRICSLYKAFRITIQPKNSSGNYLTIPQIAEIKVKYKKKNTLNNWTTRFFYNSSTNYWSNLTFDIDGLENDQEYRLKLYYKPWLAGSHIKIDKTKYKTR